MREFTAVVDSLSHATTSHIHSSASFLILFSSSFRRVHFFTISLYAFIGISR